VRLPAVHSVAPDERNTELLPGFCSFLKKMCRGGDVVVRQSRACNSAG